MNKTQMILIRKLVFLSVVAVLLTTSMAQVQTPELASTPAGKAQLVPMPQGFANIEMLMTLSDFLKARPKVEPTSPFATKVSKDQQEASLSEFVKDPLFDTVRYRFSKGKLVWIHFVGYHEEGELQEKITLFFQKMLKAYGTPSFLKVGMGTTDKRPEVFWKKGNILVTATLTPQAKKYIPKNRGYVSLTIATGEWADLTVIDRFPVVTKAEAEEIIAPMRQLLNKSLPEKTSVPLDLTPSKTSTQPASRIDLDFAPSWIDDDRLLFLAIDQLLEQSINPLSMIRLIYRCHSKVWFWRKPITLLL